MGTHLAMRDIGLVNGGAKVGLMGILADSALAAGGEVIGVLPKFLKAKEIAHQNLSDLILVESMHERKTRMNDLSDGAIALPGGFGTLEEFFEMLTWGQLGLHQKPLGILNIDGFYSDLLDMLDTMVNKGFLKEVNRQMVLVSKDVDALLEKMDRYRPADVPKWISKETS